jgi:NADH dehydrogenase FAD-containing subunit
MCVAYLARNSDGTVEPFDLCIVSTGAVAHEEVAESFGLPTDANGFVRIADTLEVHDSPGVFAVGDCCAMQSKPLPKAGVYAVRMGPPLTENLYAALKGLRLLPFHPQEHFLSLLMTGE